MASQDPIERRGGDYILRLDGAGTRYRVTVPHDLLDDEVGHGTDDDARRTWIEANLAHILGAVTATETGGMVGEPWGRLLVEEIP
jgi:hypothetical protein